MILAGNVAFMGKMRNAYRIQLQDLKRRYYLGDLCLDGRLILK
jgi:hypothetical protein